eukprot:m.30392 g.30392  ORF g.30392 m.30392 type:complete len:684 (+) comp9274_c0_seq1:246-2297(+)
MTNGSVVVEPAERKGKLRHVSQGDGWVALNVTQYEGHERMHDAKQVELSVCIGTKSSLGICGVGVQILAGSKLMDSINFALLEWDSRGSGVVLNSWATGCNNSGRLAGIHWVANTNVEDKWHRWVGNGVVIHERWDRLKGRLLHTVRSHELVLAVVVDADLFVQHRVGGAHAKDVPSRSSLGIANNEGTWGGACQEGSRLWASHVWDIPLIDRVGGACNKVARAWRLVGWVAGEGGDAHSRGVDRLLAGTDKEENNEHNGNEHNNTNNHGNNGGCGGCGTATGLVSASGKGLGVAAEANSVYTALVDVVAIDAIFVRGTFVVKAVVTDLNAKHGGTGHTLARGNNVNLEQERGGRVIDKRSRAWLLDDLDSTSLGVNVKHFAQFVRGIVCKAVLDNGAGIFVDGAHSDDGSLALVIRNDNSVGCLLELWSLGDVSHGDGKVKGLFTNLNKDNSLLRSLKVESLGNNNLATVEGKEAGRASAKGKLVSGSLITTSGCEGSNNGANRDRLFNDNVGRVRDDTKWGVQHCNSGGHFAGQSWCAVISDAEGNGKRVLGVILKVKHGWLAKHNSNGGTGSGLTTTVNRFDAEGRIDAEQLKNILLLWVLIHDAEVTNKGACWATLLNRVVAFDPLNTSWCLVDVAYSNDELLISVHTVAVSSTNGHNFLRHGLVVEGTHKNEVNSAGT